jgi:hypothetical protein
LCDARNINLEELTKCHHKPKQESHHRHKAPPAQKNKLQELYQREGNDNTIAYVVNCDLLEECGATAELTYDVYVRICGQNLLIRGQELVLFKFHVS